MRRSGLVLAAVAALCLLLSACGSTPSTPRSTAGPSSSPEPSLALDPAPSVEPTPVPAPPDATEAPVDSVPIPSNAYARVVTDDLRVRSNPGVTDESKKLEPLLQRGVLLVVLDGPVQASGYDWYQVQPTISFEEDVSYPSGWVAAAGKDGETWIQPEQQACPDQPTDVSDLASTSEGDEMFWEITCFGGREISFRARLASSEIGCGIEPLWSLEPAWLGACDPDPLYLMSVDDKGSGIPLWPAWPPEIDTSIAVGPDQPIDDWPVVEVSGMFDHPLAQTCHSVPIDEEGAGNEEPDPVWLILNCRQQFVVTSMRQVDG